MVTTDTATPPPISLTWSADAALIDGAAITIRPLKPDDVELLRSFFTSLSAESMRLRYFSASHQLTDEELTRLTTSDAATHTHLGAFHAGSVVGVADFSVSAPGEA